MFLIFCQTSYPKNYYERDWSKFHQENVIVDYFDKDRADLLQIDQQNVNYSMDSFLNNMNSILDGHAPLKKVKYKLKFKTKSWITSALKKLISIKNNLLKKFIAAKDPQRKGRYHKEYKEYRKMLSTILKQSKTSYCNHHFQTNRSSIKNTWKGIYLKRILNIKNISADMPKSLTVDGTPTSIANKAKRNISFHISIFQVFLKIDLIFPFL